MDESVQFVIEPQPDDASCGPTCLHALYRYYGLNVDLQQVIREAHSLDEGGTLAVFLGCHALRNGFDAAIYTYNMQVFDPSWFEPGADNLAERLEAQLRYKSDDKLRVATSGYLEFLRLGGKIRFQDMSIGMIRRYLKRGRPILTGLSATYLYRSKRELAIDDRSVYDDLRGSPTGHFVVLYGYDKEEREVFIADPLRTNPMAPGHHYKVNIDRVFAAMLLGIVTYDDNFLVITPRKAGPLGHTHHRQ